MSAQQVSNNLNVLKQYDLPLEFDELIKQDDKSFKSLNLESLAETKNTLRD